MFLRLPVPPEGKWTEIEVFEDPMPPPDKVESLYREYFNDNLLLPEIEQIYLKMPASYKWEELKKCSKEERELPSPKWLLTQLREKVTKNTLYQIGIVLTLSRSEWARQFCQNNGHFDILITLSSIQARIDFNSKQENDIELITFGLLCIRGICNFKTTQKCITSHPKSLYTIINCLNLDSVLIQSMLEILISFMFEYEDDKHKIETLKKILKYLRELDRDGKNGWEIIVNADTTERFIERFIPFMRGFLSILVKDNDLLLEWMSEIENIGFFEMALSLADDNLWNLLEKVEEIQQMLIHGIDMKIISSLSIETSHCKKGQLDEIMNQLKDKNFLTTEDPFFDLTKLQVQKNLGEGTFGVVCLAICRETSELFAVKSSKVKVNEETRYSDETLSIFREVNLMSSFNFPTILKFIGYSPTNFDGKFYPTIIMEYCVNKTLSDIIDLENQGLAPEGWDDTKKLINIYGIAAGMKYLHQQSIVHRDLKTQNILMDELLCPKIADFGLSKMTKISEKSGSLNIQSSPNIKGTLLYMAPEILSGELCSKPGDVYAFAIIVYEIVTGKNPFKNLSMPMLIKKVLDGGRPDFDNSVPKHYKQLIENCWCQSPLERPTFEEIVDELVNNPEFITDSIDESNYMDFIDFVDNYQSTFDLHKKHILFDDFVKGKHSNTTLKKVHIDEK